VLAVQRVVDCKVTRLVVCQHETRLPAMPNTCKHCKVIDLVESQEQLVALITFTDSAFDLQLTDAVDAWSGQGGSSGLAMHALRTHAGHASNLGFLLP
jgi:hypothetical protein